MSRKKKSAEYIMTNFKVTHSHGMRWDRDGRCFERTNDGPEERRPDMDYGTSGGDLLIDPWIQNAIRQSKE